MSGRCGRSYTTVDLCALCRGDVKAARSNYSILYDIKPIDSSSAKHNVHQSSSCAEAPATCKYSTVLDRLRDLLYYKSKPCKDSARTAAVCDTSRQVGLRLRAVTSGGSRKRLAASHVKKNILHAAWTVRQKLRL